MDASQIAAALRLVADGRAVSRFRHLRWETDKGEPLSGPMHILRSRGLVRFNDGGPITLTKAGKAALQPTGHKGNE